nr:MAG TPA: hypothetical protein [Caudoviricetes sp.]DAE86059.1 MAG TPA: hypothetical protein [Caudoviricetes sp.]DAJ94630.1 MAG TPA: hypothetical protein [Caudoviricetes sp.]
MITAHNSKVKHKCNEFYIFVLLFVAFMLLLV